MFSHLNMSENTEIINNDISSIDTSNAETTENKESPEAESDISSIDTSNAETTENKESPEAESDISSIDTSNAETTEIGR
jgi:hypothetical protein